MAKGPTRIPLTGEVTIGVRVSAGSPRVARLQVLPAIADLGSVARVMADLAGSDLAAGQIRLLVTTRSLAALLTEIGQAPTLIDADLTWSDRGELQVGLSEAALALREGPAGPPGGELSERARAAAPLAEPAETEPAALGGQPLRRLRRGRPRRDALETPANVTPYAGGTALPTGHRGKQKQPVYIPARTVACIIPAHNEEAVIAATLRTVLRVYDRNDVYVFADACTDRTVEIVRGFLPAENVIDQPVNVGKSKGLEFVLKTLIYPQGYQYVTITDADTTMDPQFLVKTLKVLRHKEVAAAVGQVRARWYSKNVIAVYRTYVYTLWQVLYKRLQSITNSITIASGCSTTWKTRVLKQLTFDHNMSTEDFSLTIQVHRKRLGQIKYVSSAVVWSQEPWSIQSYRKQLYRWNRAWFESVRKYRVGAKWVHTKKGIPTGISFLDVSTALLTLDVAIFFFSIVVLPLLLIYPVDLHVASIPLNTRSAVLWALAWQYAGIFASAFIVAVIAKRPRIFLYSPAFLVLMYIDIFIWAKAIVSTTFSLYRKVDRSAGQSVAASVWESPERREVA